MLQLPEAGSPEPEALPQIYSPAVSRAERNSKASPKKKAFPWIVFVLLLATIYIFWIYPLQKSRPSVEVTFEPANSNNK